MRRSTFFSRPSRTRPQQGASSPERWAGKTAPLPGSSTPTVTPLMRPQSLELKSEGKLDSGCRTDRCRTWSNVLEQDHRAIPATDQRESTFPLVLGCLAYDRRLRVDPYDPQRPGLWKWVGTWHRFTAPLYSRSVRCDELNFRSSTPSFGSTVKLQHIRPAPP